MKNDIKTREQLVHELTELRSQNAELKKAESAEKYRSLVENIRDVIYELDSQGVVLYISPAVRNLLGYDSAEIVGKTPFDFMPPDEARRAAAIFSKIVANKAPIKDLENKNIGRHGEIINLLTNAMPILDKKGRLKGYRGVDKDMTERKRTEDALRKSEERYRHIVETSMEGIWIINEEFRTTFVNQRLADMLGYAREDIVGKRVDSFIFEEDLADYASREDSRRRGLGEVFERRFRRKDGTALWNIVSSTALCDSENRFTGSFSMFTDITERKKTEEQLQHTLLSLRRAVNTTIRVMVSAVETRDPYTAGHQLRSADLARAIATEMGLPREQIEGIRMAASIHDIGKLSIPAEILSKPTKLSEIEFSLIKGHARQGYEMLKDVESPWPLAEIVYQHHERMDGSGYPRNLKGEEICMEGRILNVADTVEAMASHRPYRPGLGIDAALEEIEKNRGILYDKTVADACLRLFREEGFQFAKTGL